MDTNQSDMEDSAENIASIEEELYAKIHHGEMRSIEPIDRLAGDDILMDEDQPQQKRIVTNTSIVNNARPPKMKGVRYWNENNSNKLNKKNVPNWNVDKIQNDSVTETSTTSDFRPKPFTPYMSFLSQTGITTDGDPKSDTESNPNQKPTENKSKSDTELPQSDRSTKINPRVKKQRAHKQQQNPYALIPNPFNRLNTNKIELMKKLHVKQKRSTLAKSSKPEPVTINLESDGGDDDDDVIIVPLPPVTTVTIDSSDDDDTPTTFTEPKSIQTKPTKPVDGPTNRSASPSSSIISDDFIAQCDRKRIARQNDPLNGVDDAELVYLNMTVDKTLRRKPGRKDKPNVVCLGDLNDEMVVAGKLTGPLLHTISNVDHNVDVPGSVSSDIPELITETGSQTSSDDNELIVDINPAASTTKSVIRRGVAVSNAVTSISQIGKQRKKVKSDRQDNQFISLLSCIVNGKEISDGDEKLTSATNLEIIESAVDEPMPIVNEKLTPDTGGGKRPSEPEWIITDVVGSPDNCDLSEIIPLEIDPIIDENCGKEMVNESPADGDKNDENVLSLSWVVDPEIGWNDEMKKFYHNSWGGESYNLREIRNAMPNNLNDWRICKEDIYTKHQLVRFRCNNCREKGHKMAKCPLPKRRVDTCSICGNTGHMETRCPNKCCLNCGAAAAVFCNGCENCYHMFRSKCNLCQTFGHHFKTCPDKWRRYHATTRPNQDPQRVPVPRKIAYCCICAERGHTAGNCRNALRILGYPVPPSSIMSYSNVYKPIECDSNADRYALISQPIKHFKFNWTVNYGPNAFYGRFVRAIEAQSKVKKQVKPVNIDPIEIDDPEPATDPMTMVLNPLKVFKDKSEKKLLKSLKRKEKVSSKIINPEMSESKKPRNDIEIISEIIISKPTEIITVPPPRVPVPAPVEPVIEPIDVDDLVEYDNLRCKTFNYSGQSESDNTRNTSNDESFTKFSFIDTFNEIQREKSTERNESISISNIDSDSNYSFSEYFTKKDSVPGPTPDFIPINSPVSIDTYNDDNKNKRDKPKPDESTEIRIFLTSNQCKYLLTARGNQFLNETSKKHNVIVRMEWRNHYNVLCVVGSISNQDTFNTSLFEFFRRVEMEIEKKLDISQQMPKNRQSLIHCIWDKLHQLMVPIGNPTDLLARIIKNERRRTKATQKCADRLRKELNMILFGQAGLRDGKIHLSKLQSHLSELEKSDRTEISFNTRKEIYEHVKYIFTPFRHDNYDGLVAKYNELKESNQLPKYPLSFGLKIEPTDPPATPSVDSQQLTDETPGHLAKLMEDGCSNILESLSKKIDQPSVDEKDSNNKPSDFWSKKCRDFIEKCRQNEKICSSPNALSKLDRVSSKAAEGLLGYVDYRALLNITSMIGQ